MLKKSLTEGCNKNVRATIKYRHHFVRKNFFLVGGITKGYKYRLDSTIYKEAISHKKKVNYAHRIARAQSVFLIRKRHKS